MARRAFRKLHIAEARRATGDIRLMAFLAGNLKVHTCQRVAGFGVIKLFGCFPIAGVMAADTVCPELRSVYIFVAVDALL